MRKFNIGDHVVITNIDGITENTSNLMFTVDCIGEKGKVVAYTNSDSWPVEVEDEDGVVYPYAESELERE